MSLWFWFFLVGWGFAPGSTPGEPAVAPPATRETIPQEKISGTMASRLLEKQAALWEVVGRSRDQQRRYTESQAVLQEERLEWLSERDRLTVTLSAMNRQLTKKDRRLRDLAEALYTLAHATRGQVHVRAGRRSVPRDGRIVLYALLERELREKASIKQDISRLRARRESVDQTVGELESLEESFRLLALEAETLIKRSLFELEPIERRLDGVNKLEFDARDWERLTRIRELRASLKNEAAGLVRYRGLMARPVAGPVLVGPVDRGPPSTRPGVYLSGIPGDSVRAPEAGTVRFVGPVDGFGTVIVIEHELGLHSIIGRLDTPAVKAGQTVRRAQFIAKVPAASASSAPVYLELRLGREALDPHLWLKKNE